MTFLCQPPANILPARPALFDKSWKPGDVEEVQ
jgi:hypothetical protein